MMKQCSSDPTIEYVTECLDCHEEMYLPRGGHTLYHARTGQPLCEGQRLKDAIVEAAKEWHLHMKSPLPRTIRIAIDALLEFENSGKFDA